MRSPSTPLSPKRYSSWAKRMPPEDLNTLALQCGVSSSYLSRMFAAGFGSYAQFYRVYSDVYGCGPPGKA